MLITETQEWKTLQEHFKTNIENLRISDLFKDESRFEDLFFQFDQLSIDFSKQKLTKKSFEKLIDLAKKSKLTEAVHKLVTGSLVNTTENRSALHTALRGDLSENGQELFVDNVKVKSAVKQQLEKMASMVEVLTLGQWRGFSGKAITDVVNVGVGGSDLGPLLVCDALNEYKVETKNSITVHFASTMDGSQVSHLFSELNPETTLFILVSKSFGTIDTLANAESAKNWLMNFCDDESIVTKQHFIGISTNEERMDQWGISPNNRLKLWDWVGGRFSLWSTVGLSIALKIGMNGFLQLLEGAHQLDKHFCTAKLEENLPVLLGLVGVWNSNFLKIKAQAILPYDARLKFFPNYLTQLEMESNGKSVALNGESLNYKTCPVLWGEIGPNAQHAFYQLLHQGTRKVACDFIAPISRFSESGTKYQKSLQEQHKLTLVNCFAQSRALMLGSDAERPVVVDNSSPDEITAAHKYYPGNQPSTTLLIKELTPYSLGQLIALYEHKVFVMATIWGINPFDQWGVELGKTMAEETLSALNSSSQVTQFDASTNGLMNIINGENVNIGSANSESINSESQL
ncbi:MAG: glucose-6-phosphate isomerase [Polaribacter sp.]|jgi:glucose-6-phosphate isomerase